MSYTIGELDEAIENEEDEWGGSWHEFREAVDQTHECRRDADGNFLRDAKGLIIRDPLEVPGAEIPGIGQAVLVDDFGGEGQGDQYWFVFKVTNADGERFFRRNGYYASFHGGDYDGPTDEVVAREKTIKVWVKK